MIRTRYINTKKRVRKKDFSVYYFERHTGVLKKELVPAEKWIKWLYNSPLGNVALESVVKRKGLSNLYGKYMDSRKSAVKIKSFVELFDIDMGDFEQDIENYRTFNDFFTRKIKHEKRPVDMDSWSVVSPADGRLMVFDNLQKEHEFLVKGHKFSLPEFLNNQLLAEEYINGSMFIVRLTPADYHWFHFPVSGIPSLSRMIKGKYYSVSPISIHKKTKTFRKNKREYTIIQTDLFGDVIMAEIGATFVGCVKQVYMPFKPYIKGDAKGYFKFGGSSVIVLFKEQMVQIDEDLLQNSRYSFETEIKMGERVAVSKNFFKAELLSAHKFT